MRVCNFWNKELKECINSYCYYPNSTEIACDIKKEHAEKSCPVNFANMPAVQKKSSEPTGTFTTYQR